MKDHIYISPGWFKGYLITHGEQNLGEQFFKTTEDAEDFVQHINNLLIEIGEQPIKDYEIKYKDCSSEIGPELIKELRKFV